VSFIINIRNGTNQQPVIFPSVAVTQGCAGIRTTTISTQQFFVERVLQICELMFIEINVTHHGAKLHFFFQIVNKFLKSY